MGRRYVRPWVAVSLLAAGCGASGAGTVHRRPVRPELFVANRSVFTLDRLVRRTVDGASYLIPARLSTTAIDFIRPASVNGTPNPPSPPRSSPPGIDASTGATINRPDHIEVIATGPAGRPVDISWEETCGFHRDGAGPSVSGGTGVQGEQRARLSAVIAVKLPQWSSGEDSCHVSALVSTSRFERGLSVELANY